MLGNLEKVKRSLMGHLSGGFAVALASSSAAELRRWPLGTARGVDAGLALGITLVEEPAGKAQTDPIPWETEIKANPPDKINTRHSLFHTVS